MNFIDLCMAFGRAIGRGCAACGKVVARMLRLTYRYWWLVLSVVVLAVAAALYYTRKGNLIYRANAIAIINGPSLQQFKQAYAPLQSAKSIPDDAAVKPFVDDFVATGFDTYHVIDCLDDGVADKIDFKRSVQATDTVNVVMQDRLCLQFRIKERNLALLPQIEQAIMEFLNSNNAMQQAYVTYYRNMQEVVAFNHSQEQKLDSLTTHYYFHSHPGSESMASPQSGVIFMGDWSVHLFLEDIYDHQEQMIKADRRMQLATAPVVLENHFAVDSKPVNGRFKYLFLFFLLGWIGGCVLAELIDKRKAINAWLKA